MRRLLLTALTLALAAPGAASAARFAVGAQPGVSLARLAQRVAQLTGGSVTSLAPLPALIVGAPSARGVASLPGVAYVESLDHPRRLAFVPNDPLAVRQWYLTQDRAFDLWDGPMLPTLPGVRVAVIDSGIDGGHPEFQDRIAAAQSFVGGSPLTDQQGHGTFVAGEIAATVNDAQGIAGIAFPAQLLIGKVVDSKGNIDLGAEARAVRWAIANRARVINLSLGGVRDPLDPKQDTFSSLEASAVSFAVSHGAVVVAAVGNSDQAPRTPWNYASYPAALPHVIGVSAVAQDGSVPIFSDRDAIYNDIAAPGENLLSTVPRALTAAHPTCVDQGYSDCGTDEYRQAEGTSFAAPQVSAAAALMLSVNPNLTSDQVSYLLERSAVDVNPATGCRQCPLLRDSLSGWGRLDITAALLNALRGQPPPPDRSEPDDDAGGQAATVWGLNGAIRATIDFWDDPIDVYRLRLRAGQQLFVSLHGSTDADLTLALWKPGTETVLGTSERALSMRVKQAAVPGPSEQLDYTAPEEGWYYLEVNIVTPGFTPYTLRFTKT